MPDSHIDGMMHPCVHRLLDSALLILIAVLVFLASMRLPSVAASYHPLAAGSVVLTFAVLTGALTWRVRPYLLKHVWRARCPHCGKTMDCRRVPWPVADGHDDPDPENSRSYVAYRCRACGLEYTCDIAKKTFPFYHQMTRFRVAVIFLALLCGAIVVAFSGGGTFFF